MAPTNFNLLDSNNLALILQAASVTILVLYTIFALLIVRQVDLMGRTLITPVSPVVKALAIFHAGFAIGIIILKIGLLS